MILFSGTYRTVTKTFFKLIDGYQLDLYNAHTTLDKNITSAFKSFSAAIYNTHQTTTESMIASATNFAQSVVNSSDLYPCCTKYANMALEALHTAGDGLTKCSNNLFASRIVVYRNYTKAIVDFHMAFNYYGNKYDQCITQTCNTWNCITSHLKYTIYATPITICANQVRGC